MSGRLLWTGLTMIVASPFLPAGGFVPWQTVGAWVMVAGVVLLWVEWIAAQRESERGEHHG